MELVNGMKAVNSGLTKKTESTIASTDLVQLYATNGTPNGKISKADLMDAVKASLPALLSDQSTNGTDFLSLASGALGKMSAANLASVLGETVTNNVQRLGLDFVYVPHITGTSTEPSQMAVEVLSALPNNIKSSQGFGSMVFYGIYERSGQSMFYGYWYGGDEKPYASIHFIKYDSGDTIKVNKRNNTFTVYRIPGTAI